MIFPKGIPISKRIFDLLLTLPGIILVSPVILVVAVLVRIRHGSPILFAQTRPGYQGRLFTVYKFRTMHPYSEYLQNYIISRNGYSDTTEWKIYYNDDL
jgi:lipopolysaccharide/colanic/teichoic acid biosynthesis glycosyltransferase